MTMKIKILKEFLDSMEKEFPDSEIVIDIGRKDIYDWKHGSLIVDPKEFFIGTIGLDIAVGNYFIESSNEFPKGKNFVYIVPELITTR